MRRIIYLLLVVAMMTTATTPASAGNVHSVDSWVGNCGYESYHDMFYDVVWTSTDVFSGSCTKVSVAANIKVNGAWVTYTRTEWDGYVYRSWGYDEFNFTRHKVWNGSVIGTRTIY